MKLKTKLKALAVATALAASGSAMAYSITTTSGSLFQGTFNNFGGFDWASNGTAVVDGFDNTLVNDSFTLTYWASAANVLDSFGEAIAFPGIDILLENIEYTIRATINETSTCNAFVSGACVDASFAVNSGTFDIWYSNAVNANQVTGAGITDGFWLISGDILAQPGGGFNVISGGNANLFGEITLTNSDYITPDLTNTTAATTLQIGANITGWIAPSSMPNAGGGTQALPEGYIALQADANQNFVPEPGSVALLGLGLFGLGALRRKS